jgi:hypothetical protein
LGSVEYGQKDRDRRSNQTDEFPFRRERWFFQFGDEKGAAWLMSTKDIAAFRKCPN